MLSDHKLDLIDELKQVQTKLDLKSRSDIEEPGPSEIMAMDLLPKSYKILRQYPILASRDTVSKVSDANEDNSDDCEDYLENKSEFVRNGFGRMSTVSGKSTGPGAENYNSVDEITIYGNITRKKPSSRWYEEMRRSVDVCLFVWVCRLEKGATLNMKQTLKQTLLWSTSPFQWNWQKCEDHRE